MVLHAFSQGTLGGVGDGVLGIYIGSSYHMNAAQTLFFFSFFFVFIIFPGQIRLIKRQIPRTDAATVHMLS